MVSAGLQLIAVTAIASCYLVAVTVQHPPKWYKPYSWNGPPKHSHLSVYNNKPQPHPYFQQAGQKPSKVDQCQLRKVVFTQDAQSPQYIVYKAKVPDLTEFTLCHWHNIFNYTHDQPIFSYTHSGKSRVIYSWIENSPEKTYYSLAINGHTIYRINYPEKLFKWYHVCQSWNGHTGEWQLWINTERVARGFYNLMVGKLIKGGGVALSGREYLEQALAVHHPAYSGELTLVSLYKAALTSGKAYSDHKHHHVHNFHHGYDETADEADTEEPPAAPAGPDPTPPPHLAHGGPFANGQLLPKLPVRPPGNPMPAAADEPYAPYAAEQQLFDGGLYDYYAPVHETVLPTPAAPEDETFRVNLLDTLHDTGDRYKRNATVGGGGRFKRRTAAGPRNARSGGINEPAEWEVTKVAAVCAGCETDPFGTASVLSWHDTRKQFYNGALYLPALPKCYLF